MLNGQIGVPIVPYSTETLTVTLPPSEANNLVTLSKVSADNEHAVPIARSYDGHDFETLHPLLLPVTCNAGSCSVDLPPYAGQAAVAMHYILSSYNPPTKTTEQEYARLLLQGTFGPTDSSLSEAVALGSPAAWVQDQLSKPVSLLREHYRKRTNGYSKTDLRHHGTRRPCEAGSRWNRAAFNRWRDVGKTIVEEATGTGSYYLKVDGIVRTEVATPPSVEFDLSTTSYVICRSLMENEFGTYMQFSNFVEAPTGEKGMLVVAPDANSCVNMNVDVIDMPPVFFSESTGIPSANLVNMLEPGIIDSKMLQNLVSPSTCDDFAATWPNFVRDDATGMFYVEDRRLELYDNVDGSTAERKGLLEGRCPHVPRTFLNEHLCAVRSDCSVPRYSGDFEVRCKLCIDEISAVRVSSQFIAWPCLALLGPCCPTKLNAVNLRKFYELDGKYVYRVQNLALVDTPSPCSTSSNRFVRKDAGGDGSGCTDDDSLIFPEVATALEAHLSTLSAFDQEKKRVIDLSAPIVCEYSQPDLAKEGTFTVTLPGTGASSCWTHSYRYEWSVFVMNDWTLYHPGKESLSCLVIDSGNLCAIEH